MQKGYMCSGKSLNFGTAYIVITTALHCCTKSRAFANLSSYTLAAYCQAVGACFPGH